MEAFHLSRTLKISADLFPVHPRKPHEELDVGHVLQGARRIVPHGMELHRGEMLEFGHEHVDAGQGYSPCFGEHLIEKPANFPEYRGELRTFLQTTSMLRRWVRGFPAGPPLRAHGILAC